MANETATPDLAVGLRALAILVPLFTLALTVYVVRIWTRIRPKYRLNAADYTISIAMFAEALSIVLAIVAVSRGYGRPRFLLPPDDREAIGRTTFAIFIMALWASAFARISISCLLLRIAIERYWKVVLWTNIVVQCLALGACDIIELVQCRPIRAMWSFVPGASCLPPDQVWVIVCFFGGIGMAGDVLCAILPIAIIWRLTRSVVEKVLVSILLGLGLVAAVGGILKVIILKSWDPASVDANRQIMNAFVWIRIEELLLIIGACAPTLKAPIEGLLRRRFSLPRFGPRPLPLNTVSTMPDPSRKPPLFPQEDISQMSSSAESSGQ
ncbi:hypothetical protein B0H63DRAFT_430290 [Podospora didyma]|uniref:Rhodopsin domain-containing protein n=1 Tax=Podospora didyma TaxID=330526 RepID=A0AAE0NRQ4_9PEZI|nr:hypothetical protein B0H63DRAFT_430290 [Podospora didyma]